jgi:hypothetical protein
MPVNNTHPDYDFALANWIRARDVLAGEDAVKAGGISRDTMFELFRMGEILPDGRTNQDEAALIGRMKAKG